MIRTHRFDLEALAEYEAAARYYATRQPDLDLRFIASVEDAIGSICEAPERWRVFAGREVRRALTRVFPYSILYTVEPDHILIIAVAHYSREPRYWQHRLPWCRHFATRARNRPSGGRSSPLERVQKAFAQRNLDGTS